MRSANGEAESTKLRASGEAEAIRATGMAKADAYKAGVDSLGANSYTLLQLMQTVGERNVRVVPDVSVTGNQGNAGLVDAMLGLLVKTNKESKTG